MHMAGQRSATVCEDELPLYIQRRKSRRLRRSPFDPAIYSFNCNQSSEDPPPKQQESRHDVKESLIPGFSSSNASFSSTNSSFSTANTSFSTPDQGLKDRGNTEPRSIGQEHRTKAQQTLKPTLSPSNQDQTLDSREIPNDARFVTRNLHQECLEAQLEPRRIDSGTLKVEPSSAHANWPSKGLERQVILSAQEAENLVCEGALSFDGQIFRVNHPTTCSVRFYAIVSIKDGKQGLQDLGENLPAFPDTSLAILGSVEGILPWETLEQPSMTHCFGIQPGTITLNHWVSLRNSPKVPTIGSESYACARDINHLLVLQRLHYLQGGLDLDPEVSEDFLYQALAFDPEYMKGPPVTMERQITVLITALRDPRWTDFRNVNTQVLAEYFDSQNTKMEEKFYQQLLLSVELNFRVQAVALSYDDDRRCIMQACISDKVSWDIALAKVWQSKMMLMPVYDSLSDISSVFQVTALTKDRQKKILLGFARNMKWVDRPNLQAMLEEDEEGNIPLEGKSSHTASWIAGAILPGKSAFWLIMRSLIDCNPKISNQLLGFNQMPSNFGFQYNGATYWYWESIVGKVLGSCTSVKTKYGWVGPCIQTDNLSKFQSILVQSQPSNQHFLKRQMKNMAKRSAPLGERADGYGLDEYIIPIPEFAIPTDNIKVQKLVLKHHAAPKATSDPETRRAAVVFSFNDKAFPIQLRYDVFFISIPPCRGQHVLFNDYAYETTSPYQLLHLHHWNNISRRTNPISRANSTSNSPEPTPESHKSTKHKDPSSVLVVIAFGPNDSEVLARAWASHMGFSAIVADVKETCVACCVRGAFAACVPMVILTLGPKEELDGE